MEKKNEVVDQLLKELGVYAAVYGCTILICKGIDFLKEKIKKWFHDLDQAIKLILAMHLQVTLPDLSKDGSTQLFPISNYSTDA